MYRASRDDLRFILLANASAAVYVVYYIYVYVLL